MNIICPPRISLHTFRRVLTERGSPLASDADRAYRIIVDYRIDPAFALALFAQESSYGTAGIAVQTRNFGNLKAARCHQVSGRDSNGHAIGVLDGFAVYASWLDGLLEWCQKIKNTYVREWGRATVESIIPIYAPASDGNMPGVYIGNIHTRIERWIHEDLTMEIDIIDLRGVLPVGPAPANKRPPQATKTSTTLHYNGPAMRQFTTQEQWTAHLAMIARYHMRHLGESTIAYHYAIDAQGRIYQTRPAADHAWHCANATGNVHSIAVHFPLGANQDASEEQWTSLIRLHSHLSQTHGYSAEALYSHREWPHKEGEPQPDAWVGHTDCPGSPLTARLKAHRGGTSPGAVIEWFGRPRTFEVIDGIDFANIRESHSTQAPVADQGRAQLAPGAQFEVGAIVYGERLGTNDRWAWVTTAGAYREPGFIHTSIVEEAR